MIGTKAKTSLSFCDVPWEIVKYNIFTEVGCYFFPALRLTCKKWCELVKDLPHSKHILLKVYHKCPLILDIKGDASVKFLDWMFIELDIEHPHSHSFSTALMAKNEAAIEWLKEKKCTVIDLNIYNAANLGNLDFIKWAYRKDANLRWANAMLCATSEGQIHVLEWLRTQGIKLQKEYAVDSAVYGGLETLKWVVNNFGNLDNDTLSIAVETAVAIEAVDILEWMVDTFDPSVVLNERNMDYAVYYSSAKSIKWLFDRKCPYYDKDKKYIENVIGENIIDE